MIVLNETDKINLNNKVSPNLIEWEVFNDYKNKLVAGVTTRSSFFKESIDPSNPYSSFNLGLHVGDNNEEVILLRKKLCQILDFPFESYTCANQVHGDRIMVINQTLKGKGRLCSDDAISACDALITNQPGILLNIFVADCVPIVIYDPVSLCCAAIHAGWRGVALGIVEKSVIALHSEYGSNPANLHVGIGPSIDLCCFDVEEDIASQILDDRNYSNKVSEKRGGRIHINLKQCLKEQLKKLGVDKNLIEISSFCTKCNSDYLYSYRASSGITGRFSGFIGMR